MNFEPRDSGSENRNGTRLSSLSNFASTHPLWFWLFFSTVILGLLVVTMDFGLNLFDEGIVIYGGVRFLHGDLPYRDFWTLYGPGQFILLSVLFKTFGLSVLVGRLTYFASMLGISCVMVRMGFLLLGRRASVLAVPVISLLWLAGIGPSYVYPVFPALLLVFLVALAMLLFWKDGNRWWVVLAGLGMGGLLLFRQEMAAGTTVSLLVAEVYFLFSSNTSKRAAGQKLALDSLLYVLGLMAPVGVAIVWLYRRIPLSDLYDQLIDYPAHYYNKMRGLPFPSPGIIFHPPRLLELPRTASRLAILHASLSGLAQFLSLSSVYLPVAAALAAVVFLAGKDRRGSLQRWQTATLLFLTVATPILWAGGVVRMSPQHEVQAVIPALFLCSCLFLYQGGLTRSARYAARTALICAILSCIVPWLVSARLAVGFTRKLLSAHREDSPFQTCRSRPGLERARCLYLSPEETSTTLFIENHTAPGDHIFSSGTRNDRVFANDAIIYFLTGRDTPGKWEEIEPGVTNTLAVQQALVRDFDVQRVTYVIQDASFDPGIEKNGSAIGTNVMLLNNYVDANYRPVAKFGNKTILERTTHF